MFVSESLDELCLCVWVLICSGVDRTLGVERKKEQKSPNYWPEMSESVFVEQLRNAAEFETINVPWTSSFRMRSSIQRQYKHTESLLYCVMTQGFYQGVWSWRVCFFWLLKYILISQFQSTILVDWHVYCCSVCLSSPIYQLLNQPMSLGLNNEIFRKLIIDVWLGYYWSYLGF